MIDVEAYILPKVASAFVESGRTVRQSLLGVAELCALLSKRLRSAAPASDATESHATRPRARAASTWEVADY